MKEHATVCTANVADAYCWPTFSRRESHSNWRTGFEGSTLDRLAADGWKVTATGVSVQCCKDTLYHFILERDYEPTSTGEQ